ncbi:MAG TPA: PIG-L family deacetylase, partial [Anaerolineales bacterium]|nr:PIG-L family deacetylase [Anaerolineales bacterium]
MRTDELMRAAKELGLKEVIFLGYRDSGMPGMEANQHPNAQINHPVEEVAGKVVKHIRAIKPDVVITFDPIAGISIQIISIFIRRRYLLSPMRMMKISTLKQEKVSSQVLCISRSFHAGSYV